MFQFSLSDDRPGCLRGHISLNNNTPSADNRSTSQLSDLDLSIVFSRFHLNSMNRYSLGMLEVLILWLYKEEGTVILIALPFETMDFLRIEHWCRQLKDVLKQSPDGAAVLPPSNST